MPFNSAEARFEFDGAGSAATRVRVSMRYRMKGGWPERVFGRLPMQPMMKKCWPGCRMGSMFIAEPANALAVKAPCWINRLKEQTMNRNLSNNPPNISTHLEQPAFSGFPEACFDFFAALERHNNRDWFNGMRESYATQVISPAQAFVEALGMALAAVYPHVVFDTRGNGSGSMFRLARDSRFSKDKSPYKTNLGLRFWLSMAARQAGRVGLYVHLDKSGVRVYGGAHRLSPEELAAFRDYVADEWQGGSLRSILSTLEKQEYGLEGERLLRVPRGYAADHACADLLRYKSLFAMSPKIERDAALDSGLVGLCLSHAAALKPLNDWFTDALPPASKKV